MNEFLVVMRERCHDPVNSGRVRRVFDNVVVKHFSHPADLVHPMYARSALSWLSPNRKFLDTLLASKDANIREYRSLVLDEFFSVVVRYRAEACSLLSRLVVTYFVASRSRSHVRGHRGFLRGGV